jgi:transcriptional regulator with XRE-family HTH domain
MKSTERSSELPQILKKLRERNRFSQKQIAEMLNISQAKYNYFESGRYSPDILSIKILADLYNLSVAELLEEPALIKKGTLDTDHDHEIKKVEILREKHNSDREKLIVVYEKRIAELEEKCSRKDIKIVSLLAKLENQYELTKTLNY